VDTYRVVLRAPENEVLQSMLGIALARLHQNHIVGFRDRMRDRHEMLLRADYVPMDSILPEPDPQDLLTRVVNLQETYTNLVMPLRMALAVGSSILVLPRHLFEALRGVAVARFDADPESKTTSVLVTTINACQPAIIAAFEVARLVPDEPAEINPQSPRN